MWFPHTAAYSPIPYVPAAVGIRLSEAFGLNVGATVQLTRIADDRGVSYGGDIPLSIDGLMGYAFGDYNRKPVEPERFAADPVAYLLVVGFALRALRGFRIQWLAFTVAVLPIALFRAGTVTADTMTNALALLVKGLFLGARLMYLRYSAVGAEGAEQRHGR
ncbi:DUF2142 domain-containing protein [Nocardia terpenica]|uniref:Uncharacterized protein n=1 Tax=Nocardia terpenica TaxID=455432 RepID=A0A164H907_9NOCA|nr:DUF2142 domain-containing protein [Nocardia terpenica]KZM68302.1 hypothetical protein AWN90_10420 [Nocardia terpenica]